MPAGGGGRRLRIESVLARLTREPFNLSIAECRKLTLHQLAHIYSHGTDDQGNLDPIWMGEEDERSDKERTLDGWKRGDGRGLSRRELEIWWREKQEVDRFRKEFDAGWLEKIERGATLARDELARQGHRGDKLENLAASERVRIMDEAEADWLARLAAFRAGQVRRRKVKGRVW